jgi:hypothetical protein
VTLSWCLTTKNIDLYNYVTKIHSFGPYTRPCLTATPFSIFGKLNTWATKQVFSAIILTEHLSCFKSMAKLHVQKGARKVHQFSHQVQWNWKTHELKITQANNYLHLMPNTFLSPSFLPCIEFTKMMNKRVFFYLPSQSPKSSNPSSQNLDLSPIPHHALLSSSL